MPSSSASKRSASDAASAASSPAVESTRILPTLTLISARVQIFVVSGCMPAPLSSAYAAVNRDDLPGEVARLFRCEEDGERRHFVRPPDAAHRDQVANLAGR